MRSLWKLLLPLSVLVAVGCAGAPDPEPEPEPTPETETAVPVETEAAAPHRAEATRLRSIVERNDFGKEAPEEYAAAETAFTAAEEAYGDAPDQAIPLFNDAADGYRAVIARGSSMKAERVRAEVHAERDQAREVRAEVAQRARYEQAEQDLERAETLLEEAEYEDAFVAFEDARGGFSAAYVAAREQRDRARRQLDQLDSDLVETSGRLERMQQDMEANDE